MNINSSQPSIQFGPEIWNLQNQGGISRYFYNLITNLDKLQLNISLAETRENSDSTYLTNLKEHLTKRFNSSDFDIYHATYFNSSNLMESRKRKCLNVLTVYDLISELFPERRSIFSFRESEKSRAIKLADHIICISETTKKDLINYYNLDESQISVTYLATDFSRFLSQNLPLLSYPSSFLLYVGKRGGYKNFASLLQAFAITKFFKRSFILVCFGGGVFTKSETNMLDELGMTQSVFHTTGDDEYLASHYLNAFALIYPSLYEGFGLPPLEAMSLGCPVLTANAGSLPEICQDAAVFFNPTSISDISSKLELLYDSSKLRAAKIDLGFNRSKDFSWLRTATQTAEIYKKLLQK